MAHKLSKGPQSRAPLKWGEGAKNLTASRHQGCPTKVPLHPPAKVFKAKGGINKKDKGNVQMSLGSWNVRTMAKGKLENVKREMRRAKLNVLGLCETRWDNNGEFVSDEFRVIHAGSKGGQKGVAIILDRKTGENVSKIVQHSDRLLLVKVKATPVDVVLIQIYMPTSDTEDEEIESMYEQIEDLVKKEKPTDQVIIMGDMNAIVGEGRDGNEVGAFGLG